jgi:hypothetical protein
VPRRLDRSEIDKMSRSLDRLACAAQSVGKLHAVDQRDANVGAAQSETSSAARRISTVRSSAAALGSLAPNGVALNV